MSENMKRYRSVLNHRNAHAIQNNGGLAVLNAVREFTKGNCKVEAFGHIGAIKVEGTSRIVPVYVDDWFVGYEDGDWEIKSNESFQREFVPFSLAEPKRYRSPMSGIEVLAMKYVSPADQEAMEAWLRRADSHTFRTRTLSDTSTLHLHSGGKSGNLRLGEWLVQKSDGRFEVLHSSRFEQELFELIEPSTFSFDAETLSIIADLDAKHPDRDVRDVLKDVVASAGDVKGKLAVTIPPPDVLFLTAKRQDAAERLIDVYSKYVRSGEKGSVYLSLDRDPKQRGINARELAEALGEYTKLCGGAK